MQQYFIDEIVNIGQKIAFDKEQSHHMVNVLRMKNNDIVRISDKYQHLFFVRIEILNKQVFGVAEKNIKDDTKANVEITLVQGLIKGEKWDYVIQKACELGVSKIIPFISSRSVVKIQDEKLDKKLLRWNKIAREACEQCKRSTLVEVHAPILFQDISNYASDVNIIAYEEANVKSEKLYKLLRNHKETGSITCVIGSEGGFSKQEVEDLNAKGFARVSLGSRILRAETAAISIINSIEFYYEMIGDNYDEIREITTEEI